MRRALPITLAGLLVGLTLVVAPAATAAGEVEPFKRQLSNERTLSRWAHVTRPTLARRAPDADARTVKRLSTRTADGSPEVVLALQDRRYSNGDHWVEVRLPMRPNGETGWVPREALGDWNRVTTRLRIYRDRRRAVLYDKDRVVWSAPIGIGKRQWPTPGGPSYVRERIIPADRKGIYGTRAIGLSAYSDTLSDWPGGGVIGIHGTNQPGLLPGRVSHGCVRVENRRIERLWRLMPLGTPVRVL